jgi:type IV pilus assembly protein PilX
MNRKHSSKLTKQSGSVLITTLILLVMLTVLTLATISLNTTQTRVAANTADAQEAYQTAEGALNQAASKLRAGTYVLANFVANTNGLYIFDPANQQIWTTVNSANTWSNAASAIQCTNCGVSTSAAYIIEYMPPVTVPGTGPQRVYRVTAHAVGVSGKSPVTLQAVVLIP